MTSAMLTEERDNLICWQIALEKKGACRFESEAWNFYTAWWGAVCNTLYPMHG